MAEDSSASGFVIELLNIVELVCSDATLDANPLCCLAFLSVHLVA
jgi:hypothetical protein